MEYNKQKKLDKLYDQYKYMRLLASNAADYDTFVFYYSDSSDDNYSDYSEYSEYSESSEY